MKKPYSAMFMDSSAEKSLHLVSFDIPIPANYGGAIDIYYKILALKNAGVHIHLHCFQYGRDQADLLNKACDSVKYYPRDRSLLHVFSSQPFIVKSRWSDKLLRDLQQTHFPILFEGLHTCSFLDHPALKGRMRIVRTHNIEHEYYANLSRIEKNLLKKIFFRYESSKLLRFEDHLAQADGVAAISMKDCAYFKNKFANTPIETISAFHPFNKVDIKEGKGDFALYHGSLEVGENNKAALYLIREVFNDLALPLVIAGNKPSNELKKTIEAYPNVKLITHLTTEQIYELVANAQINILPTFQATGIKLKLMAALYTGRHCVVNHPMVEHTGLEALTHIGDNPQELKSMIKALQHEAFTKGEIEKREKVLGSGFYSNNFNINKLIRMLFV